MIVDTHVHLFPREVRENWERIAETEKHFAALVRSPVHRWADAREVLVAMDEDGVDESWICGFAFTDISLCRICNDYILDVCRESGGRLKPLAVVPPLARGMEEEIARCAALGAIGIGELFPDGQGFCLTDVRETWRLAAACHENDMFLYLHCAEPVGREYAGRGTTGVSEAYGLAVRHPELTIILAHCGGGLLFYESMSDVRNALKNVWYDIAAIPYLYTEAVLNMASSAGVCGKLLYGSDYPILRLPRYRKLLDKSSLDESEKAAILGGNAKALLESVQ